MIIKLLHKYLFFLFESVCPLHVVKTGSCWRHLNVMHEIYLFFKNNEQAINQWQPQCQL